VTNLTILNIKTLLVSEKMKKVHQKSKENHHLFCRLAIDENINDCDVSWSIGADRSNQAI